MINDPVEYPIYFSIGKREAIIIQERFAIVKFFADGNRALKKLSYRNDKDFIIDNNVFSTNFVNKIDNEKSAIFEFTNSGADILSSSVLLKVWKNDKNNFLVKNTECIDFTHNSWAKSNTNYIFYSSLNLKRWNPVLIEGVEYYPSVSIESFFENDFYTPFTFSDFILKPGENTVESIINVGNYGILNIVFKTVTEWYFDSNREVLVSDIPNQLLEIKEKSFGLRGIFLKSGKIRSLGSIDQQGVISMDGIFTQEYVKALNIGYGNVTFLGYNNNEESIFAGREEDIIVNFNGHNLKPGKENSIYFL